MKYPAHKLRGCVSVLRALLIPSLMVEKLILFLSASLCSWIILVLILSKGRVTAAAIPVARMRASGSTNPYSPNLVKNPSLK